MELYQLRTFVMVAREGNLSRAAERLFTSQPAVSAHIKALEEEFGLKLFERTTGGMVPTPAGETLWEEAERLLHSATDLSGRAAALKGRVAGLLRVGLNNDVSVLRANELLLRLATEHPALRYRVEYGTSGVLLEAVVAREMDVAFYEGPVAHPAVEAVALTELEIVVVVPPGWSAELDAPDWRRLEAKPWVLGNAHCSFSPLVAEIERDYAVRLDRRFEIDDDATSLTLVAGGQAVAMTSRGTLAALPHLAAQVVVWPHFARKQPLSAIYLRNRASDPAILAFLHAVRRLFTRAAG